MRKRRLRQLCFLSFNSLGPWDILNESQPGKMIFISCILVLFYLCMGRALVKVTYLLFPSIIGLTGGFGVLAER